jgi:hypothetical protein
MSFNKLEEENILTACLVIIIIIIKIKDTYLCTDWFFSVYIWKKKYIYIKLVESIFNLAFSIFETKRIESNFYEWKYWFYFV